MGIEDYCSSHSRRQTAVWNAWLDLEMNRPGRLDHHVMMVAMRVEELINLQCTEPGKSPAKASLDNQRVKFSLKDGKDKQKKNPLAYDWTPEKRERFERALQFMRFGYGMDEKGNPITPKWNPPKGPPPTLGPMKGQEPRQ